MFTTQTIGTCPKCGCMDIRDKTWCRQCFKCGYIEEIEPFFKRKSLGKQYSTDGKWTTEFQNYYFKEVKK